MLINFFPCFLFHSIFKSKTNHLHVVKELRGSGFSLPFRIGTLAHDPLLKNGPYGLGRKEEKEERKEGKEERKKEKKEGRQRKNGRKKRSIHGQEQPGRRSLHLLGRGEAVPFPGRWEHLSFSRVYSSVF